MAVLTATSTTVLGPSPEVLFQSNFPTATWEKISPEVAAHWLETFNAYNRSLRRGHIARLTRDMQDGMWQGLNAETICFDTQGRLIDGQHRLSACVNSGIPIISLVVRGVPDDCYMTKGIGAKKHLADFLHPEGHKNALLLASTARIVALWMDGNLHQIKNDAVYPTVARQNEIVQIYPELQEVVDWVASKKGVRDILTPTFACLICFAGRLTRNGPLALAFLERLAMGAGVFDNEPVFHLRKFLLANKSSKRRFQQPHILALLIKTWNATLEERQMRALQLRTDEAFPVLELP